MEYQCLQLAYQPRNEASWPEIMRGLASEIEKLTSQLNGELVLFGVIQLVQITSELTGEWLGHYVLVRFESEPIDTIFPALASTSLGVIAH